MGDLSTDLPTVHEIIKPYIHYANSFLTRLVPSFENILMLALAFVISYYLCNKYNWTRFSLVGMTILFYGGIRYLGFGVP